ncbi:GntR family transcriptional regulator [Cupriavidus basilensis]
MQDGDPLLSAASSPGISRYGRITLAATQDRGRRMVARARRFRLESTLAAEFGIALGTIRQAIAVLVQEGLLERVQGKGTFVRNGLTGASMMRFFRFRADAGTAGMAIPRSRSCRAARRGWTRTWPPCSGSMPARAG